MTSLPSTHIVYTKLSANFDNNHNIHSIEAICILMYSLVYTKIFLKCVLTLQMWMNV